MQRVVYWLSAVIAVLTLAGFPLLCAQSQAFAGSTAAGLANLRTFAIKHGYINFTAVPDARVDDEHQTISLVIDIDEGKQFRVSSVKVIGLDDPAPLQPGQVYNDAVATEFRKKHARLLPAGRGLDSRL